MSISNTARDALSASLQAHGLLTTDSDSVPSVPDLMPRVLALCFPEYDLTGRHVEIAFESAEERARIEQALLFGWVTADLLSPTAGDDRSRLLCALFNLGIGMIDSFCDSDPQRGSALLECLASLDVDSAASREWRGGRMVGSLSISAAANPAIAFTARVIDAFFSVLHATHAPPLRREVGRLLAAALTAEQRSLERSASPAELLEVSRSTSVLPFLIIGTLARGDMEAATHLGEAMWRIDDLIDVEADAESGALNSLILGGTLDRERIEAAAREAAEHLRAGIGAADGRRFLWFVRSYSLVNEEGQIPQ